MLPNLHKIEFPNISIRVKMLLLYFYWTILHTDRPLHGQFRQFDLHIPSHQSIILL